SEWQDWLVDDSDNQETTYAQAEETSQRRELLNTALKTLTERERHILEQRRLIDEPKTLEDLSAKYGISRERVRQIEVRAFDKLQKAMKNMVVEAAAKPTTQPGAQPAPAHG
ncbi:MAG: sigma-70 family RNA polymerase sigma factor, partial [Reyranella sp.]|nr:sigma-70 family RNA polymerase sigma factor [Reyranella sp.]